MARRGSSRAQRLAALALLGIVGALAVLPFSAAADAASSSGPTTTASTPPSSFTTFPIPKPVNGQQPTYGIYWRGVPLTNPPFDAPNSGMPNSTIRVFNKNGQLMIYGNRYVQYVLPQCLVQGACTSGSFNGATKAIFAAGAQLYAQNCASCHGVTANGVPPQKKAVGGFPSLQVVGPAAILFWVESGRMPATSTSDTQPIRRPQRLSDNQAIDIATWITTQYPVTPLVPVVNLNGANLSDGAQLFAANCAACHTISGDGDALANDTFAPSMRDVPVAQVAEAMRTGPANMPIFTGNMTDQQLRDVVAYVVDKIQHPQNPGGLGLGGLGPVGEGFIGLALGVGLLALVGFWIGDRS